MKVKPVLGDWEIPRVASIKTLERRSFGETPTRIAITGSLYGDEIKGDFLERVRHKYRKGEPVVFVADIVTATNVQYVIIETLVFQESGVTPDQTDYLVVLKDSPPPISQDPLDSIDAGLTEQAKDFINSATSTLDMIDELGNAPDFSNPSEAMRNALADVASITSGLENSLGPLRAIFEATE